MECKFYGRPVFPQGNYLKYAFYIDSLILFNEYIVHMTNGHFFLLPRAPDINLRYKNKTEKTLRSIVESFRVYSDGLNFSADIKKDDFV